MLLDPTISEVVKEAEACLKKRALLREAFAWLLKVGMINKDADR